MGRNGAEERAAAAAPFADLSQAARDAFVELGRPPLEDPDALLVWGRKVLATLAWLAMMGEVDPPRVRAIKDLVFAIGSTHNRADIEARTKRVEKLVERRTQRPAIEESSGPMPKGPNSRGVRKPPRSVPGDDDAT